MCVFVCVCADEVEVVGGVGGGGVGWQLSNMISAQLSQI